MIGMPGGAEMEKKEKGFVSHLFFWIAVGFVSVAIYVLSTGPVIKLFDAPGASPGPAILAVYAPLVWLSEWSRSFNSFMDWYVKKVWRVGN
jgi:hypothetical protein